MALTWAAPLPPAPPALSEPPALRIVSDRTLPPALEEASDIRWASDRTVYLPLAKYGTVEASVDASGPPPRERVGGSLTVGGWTLSSWVGASPAYLVVAGHFFGLTWRSLDRPLRKEAAFNQIQDIDVSGSRLLVLGTRSDEHIADVRKRYAPDGTIAWIGSLDKDLSDLRPVLADTGGPGAPTFSACGSFEMGAIRFLPGGSFIVVPGIQPGAHLYDAQAKLIRVWDTVSLGLDSDCAGLVGKEAARLAVDFDARVAWLNRRRTLDEILPLPQGPGLVVRTVVDGRPRWQLKVLTGSGGVTTYAIPIAPESARSHLRGDTHGGKIAFLLTSWPAAMYHFNHPPPRLVIALVPGF
ncbi:MAG: hypothetical protein M3O15_12405 [Acidobacteriota bacterium]|nr:hypothetical protein [Acidobacteriota bacterium]